MNMKTVLASDDAAPTRVDFGRHWLVAANDGSRWVIALTHADNDFVDVFHSIFNRHVALDEFDGFTKTRPTLLARKVVLVGP